MLVRKMRSLLLVLIALLFVGPLALLAQGDEPLSTNTPFSSLVTDAPGDTSVEEVVSPAPTQPTDSVGAQPDAAIGEDEAQPDQVVIVDNIPLSYIMMLLGYLSWAGGFAALITGGIDLLKPKIITPLKEHFKWTDDGYLLFIYLTRAVLAVVAYHFLWGGVTSARAYLPGLEFIPNAGISLVTVGVIVLGAEVIHAWSDKLRVAADVMQLLAGVKTFKVSSVLAQTSRSYPPLNRGHAYAGADSPSGSVADMTAANFGNTVPYPNTPFNPEWGGERQNRASMDSIANG